MSGALLSQVNYSLVIKKKYSKQALALMFIGNLVGRPFLSVPASLAMVDYSASFWAKVHLSSYKFLGNEWSVYDALSNHKHDLGQSWGVLCD